MNATLVALVLVCASSVGCAVGSTQRLRFGSEQGFVSPPRKGSTVYVERELPFAADVIWDTIYADFGGVSNFHPHFVDSGYLRGEALELGAERYCHTAEDGSAGVHERIVFVDEEQREVQFQIFEAFGVPLDTGASFGTSQLVPLDEGRTLFRIRFVFKTRPFFAAWFAKGRVRREIEDMTIGMEHYLATGEVVTKDTFLRIRRTQTKP